MQQKCYLSVRGRTLPQIVLLSRKKSVKGACLSVIYWSSLSIVIPILPVFAGKSVNLRDVKELVTKMNVQLDNLCQVSCLAAPSLLVSLLVFK